MMRIARFLGSVALLNLCSENTHPKESWQAILSAARKAFVSAGPSNWEHSCGFGTVISRWPYPAISKAN